MFRGICLIIIASTLLGLNKLPTREYEELPMSEPTPIEIFMRKISDIESGGKHRVVNQYGMMGKYQFSPSTVRVLGFRVTQQEFLNNPELQDTVMVTYMRENQRYLQSLITRYDGRVVNGVKITRATVLAGAHFAGPNTVRLFLTSRDVDNFSDGNGTKLTWYMKKFEDTPLPEIIG
jgi:hypothetical protein